MSGRVRFVPYGGPADPGHPIAHVRVGGRELLYANGKRLAQWQEEPVSAALDLWARLLVLAAGGGWRWR